MAASAPPELGMAPVARPRVPWWGWLLITGGLAGLAVVWHFEPRGQFFYPRCWLYQTTGLKCPGCGSTRAVHALLHGDLRGAWAFNPLFVALLPGAAWLMVRGLRGWRTGYWWPNPLANRYAIAALLGIAAGFGIARNLSWWPW